MTAPVGMAAGQRAFVQELVWGRLGRTALGAAALTRLQEEPSEGSAGIVVSVLADELRADPDFAGLLTRPARTHPPAAEVRRVWLLGVLAPVLLYVANAAVP
ncbi:hypothetical protein ABT354_35780 [Streptomyces sp. NPDC000594]|uniref:hypothetical protein n=1 Tax=Streptomyces sp. NPDC000594 TaxID=3154261 RepID=UPI00332E6C96